MTLDKKTALAFAAPPHVMFEIDGVELDIHPLTVGETLKLLPMAERCIDGLVLLDETMFDRLADGQPTPADLMALTGLLAKHGEDLLLALAIAARQPTPWVHGLLFDRLVELLVCVVQVNKDFFGRAMPGITARLETLAKAKQAAEPLPSAGQPPSSSS
jgi:hypothetical protein